MNTSTLKKSYQKRIYCGHAIAAAAAAQVKSSGTELRTLSLKTILSLEHNPYRRQGCTLYSSNDLILKQDRHMSCHRIDKCYAWQQKMYEYMQRVCTSREEKGRRMMLLYSN